MVTQTSDNDDMQSEGLDVHRSPTNNDIIKRLRGVRGATTVAYDDAALIFNATQELLQDILERNNASKDDIISALFTTTPDLRSDFPARAARELGWADVPMLCSVEMDVVNALPFCIRVLLHIELAGERAQVRHVYLNRAEELRPDL